jgi:PilZ domain-containing protein
MAKTLSGDLRPRRYRLLLPLRVWIRSWARGKPAKDAKLEVEGSTITENISSSGCYFLLDDAPEVGSRIEMEIKMAPKAGAPPGSTVECRGRVVRVEKEQHGGKTGVGCTFDRYRILPSSKKS